MTLIEIWTFFFQSFRKIDKKSDGSSRSEKNGPTFQVLGVVPSR